MLQIVLFAIIIGVALVSLRAADAKPLLDLLGSLQRVCMTVVNWTMRLAPIAVVGLMMRVISQLGVGALIGLAAYVGTVLLGLAILLLLYLLMVAVVGGRSPLGFVRAVRDVQLLAFSTSRRSTPMIRALDMSRTAVNVTGDLTACIVMDRWVGGKRTLEQERSEQAELEVRRTASGEDVIVVDSPPDS